MRVCIPRISAFILLTVKSRLIPLIHLKAGIRTLQVRSLRSSKSGVIQTIFKSIKTTQGLALNSIFCKFTSDYLWYASLERCGGEHAVTRSLPQTVFSRVGEAQRQINVVFCMTHDRAVDHVAGYTQHLPLIGFMQATRKYSGTAARDMLPIAVLNVVVHLVVRIIPTSTLFSINSLLSI